MIKFAKIDKLITNFVIIAKSKSKIYGPYQRKSDGRRIIIIRNRNGKCRTMSYAKYVMEKHLGRKLTMKDTIDHKDYNRLNDDPSNYQIFDRSTHSKLDVTRVKLIKCKCDFCNKSFERSPRIIRDRAKNKSRGIFCSKSCSAKYSKEVQMGRKPKLPPQQHVESEYYKLKIENEKAKKKLKANIELFIKKIG